MGIGRAPFVREDWSDSPRAWCTGPQTRGELPLEVLCL